MSRHLDPSTRSLVAPRLQNLTEDTIARVVFNPEKFESEETIQGLIVLSLWMPVCGSARDGGGDGRMLIGMAVTMAMNLRLNEAIATVMSLRGRLPGDFNQAVLEKALNRARLVSAWSSNKPHFSLQIATTVDNIVYDRIHVSIWRPTPILVY